VGVLLLANHYVSVGVVEQWTIIQILAVNALRCPYKMVAFVKITPNLICDLL